MMSEKRYFKIGWYLFDSTTISEQLVKEQAEYGYGVFANSLSPSEVVDLLNEQQATINELKEENKKLREEWEFSFRTELAHHRVAEKELQEKIREQQATIEQLQAQLLICQQSKNDDGRFQVWEVPPIPKGTRITFSTTERSGKNE